MRRITLSTLAVAALVALPSVAEAQVSFGAQLAWHEDADIGVGAVVKAPLPSVHEAVGFMGDFTWFFPGDEGDVDVDYLEINGNLTYDFILEDNPSLVPFALAGLNIARLKASAGGVSGSDTEVGLNLGGGLTFGDSSLRPSVGAKVELSGGEGFVIFGSIMLGG